jgi:hypothetical protein
VPLWNAFHKGTDESVDFLEAAAQKGMR